MTPCMLMYEYPRRVYRKLMSIPLRYTQRNIVAEERLLLLLEDMGAMQDGWRLYKVLTSSGAIGYIETRYTVDMAVSLNEAKLC